jgi:hypothetical protein
MKRLLLLAGALAVSAAADAQLYKWVDKDGKVTYSDQPPPAGPSKQLGPVPAAPTGSAPIRSAVDRDKELEAGRKAAEEKAKVAAELERKAKFDEENCQKARNYLRTVTDGGRISTVDAKGERYLLDDAQIAAERVKAQKAVEESCKAS